ncbi:MAG: phage portal protein [Pseudomonadota bacterium]
MIWPFRKRPQEIAEVETRAAGSGFTAEVISAREAYISGRRGIAELTGTVQACVSLWEGGLAVANVEGTDLLSRRVLAMLARSLAFRGEALFLIGDRGLVPVSDWDLRTRGGFPSAYRLTLPEVGGGTTTTALAGEVLHFRIGSDLNAPWAGQAPLKRAQLSAGLLQALEAALGEIYETAPLGSQIVPYPEAPETDAEALARGFRGNRGKVLLRESVNVSAAGGPAPQTDWHPHDLTPDLEKALPLEALGAARNSVANVYGVLPAMLSPGATGPLVREGQRHLAQWMLQPIAELIAEEATAKLGSAVSLDVMRPLQAYDAGGRARAAATVVQALAMAKEAGVDPDAAMRLVDWSSE